MQAKKSESYIFPISVIGLLFFIFGFITWANSQLIPYLKTACQLSQTEAYFVGTAFFAAYFFMAIPSSYILKLVGFKRGMAIGLFIMAAGALLFIPAAQARSYPMFLSGLFVIGTGLALLQTAANPYVTILGPIESAAQRISIMGVCNKLAGIIAIYLLGFLFLHNIDQIEASLATLTPEQKNVVLDELAQKVIQPYLLIAAAFALLGVGILFINLPEIKEEEIQDNIQLETKSVLEHRNLLLGALAIFVYVGAEVISYDAFSTLGIALGFDKLKASSFAQYTALAMLAGYFSSIVLIPGIIKQRPALILSAVMSIVFLLLALFTSGYTAVFFFAMLGFSQAAMWPAIWPLALNGLGRHTKFGAAILIMMIVGGAILMPLMGYIAEQLHNTKAGFYIMIPCWLYIIYYAADGYRSKYLSNKEV